MNCKTKKVLWAVFPLFFLLLPSFFALAALEYIPMEEIPGFDTGSSFAEYVLVLYKFGLWTIGVSGMLMITIGGFMYITSGGNTSTTGKAKGIISDAIAGIILALLSYLLLYIINPNLVNTDNQAVEKAAKKYGSVPEDDPTYGKYPVISSSLPKKCQTERANGTFSGQGVEECLLVATAAMESSCDANVKSTNGGTDCGMMQTRANTSICPYSCSELSADASLAVKCGAAYLNYNYDHANKSGRTSPEGQVLRDKYAAYNGGSGALNPSDSCKGMTNSYGNPYDKWDCPKECGGYCPVPARTSRFLNYYNECKGGDPIE